MSANNASSQRQSAIHSWSGRQFHSFLNNTTDPFDTSFELRLRNRCDSNFSPSSVTLPELRRLRQQASLQQERSPQPQIAPPQNLPPKSIQNQPAVVGNRADFFGDRGFTAYNIGNVSGTYNFTWSGSVNPNNRNDFYRFELGDWASVTLTLNGMWGDGNLRLLDANGVAIARSMNPGTQQERISRWLAPGSYLVQVMANGNARTSYNIALATQGNWTDPGWWRGNALDLGEVSRSFRQRTEYTGNFDFSDFYRFELRESTNLHISLFNLRDDLDMRLMDIGGLEIAHSSNWGLTGEWINRVLLPGTYYLEVYQGYSWADSWYDLRIDGFQHFNPGWGFSYNTGYGLVDAAAAVAASIGQLPFAQVNNWGGWNWSNDMINAPEAWARGFTGQNAVVAVIDDGVDIFHPDLWQNIWRNWDEIPNNGWDDDFNGFVDDVNGWNFATTWSPWGNNNVLPQSPHATHGTHVAGIIAAHNNGFGTTGVAPSAQIMPIRIADTTTDGRWINTGSLAEAIRYAVNNGAWVINMSLMWEDSAELRDALAYAAARDVIVVTAAGNDRLDSPAAPAYYAFNYGISVGAVDGFWRLANFSNRAGSDSWINHVVAPGVNIMSTFPGGQYAGLNGTSMAAPKVSGVVALMLSANSWMTRWDVQNILRWTSRWIA